MPTHETEGNQEREFMLAAPATWWGQKLAGRWSDTAHAASSVHPMPSPYPKTEGAGRGLSAEQREALGMAVSTGCGCWPDGACHDCAFVHHHLVPVVERILAEHVDTALAEVERLRKENATRDAALVDLKASYQDVRDSLREKVKQAEAERDRERGTVAFLLDQKDQHVTEIERLRAQVAAVAAVAEKWDHDRDLVPEANKATMRAAVRALLDSAVAPAIEARALRSAADEPMEDGLYAGDMYRAYLYRRADRIEGAR
jgi:hypothetical protein